MHGFGEKGTDNQKQLKGVGAAFTKKAIREKFPAFLVVPQSPGSWIPHPVFDKPIAMPAKPATPLLLATELVSSLEKKHPIDSNRLYLMGYSNGACAVWELLERYPKTWAAAVPMAGAGEPRHVAAAAHVAIWAFHGKKDPTIPIHRMEELMSALEAAQGHPLYTVIPNGVHYDAKGKGLADPTVIPWMFAQKRGQPVVAFDSVAGPKAKRPTSLEK
ncbi:MAG TPA: dienelactone hydrolase family protein [Gemmataceae bacterium]|nr:dienelactone hydrolase family protein [Gemmataceae bacterium]